MDNEKPSVIKVVNEYGTMAIMHEDIQYGQRPWARYTSAKKAKNTGKFAERPMMQGERLTDIL